MLLPVRHFRVDDHTVAVESAFAEHLRLLRCKIGETANRLVIASPSMTAAAYEESRRNLSLVNEATDQIVFCAVFADDAVRSMKGRIQRFWPVMRNTYRLVQQSVCIQSGFSWNSSLPFEFAALVFGLLLRRRTVFVVDIDYRRSAYMSYRNGDWSLKSYLACKYLYDVARSVQLRIATRYCSLVLLKGEKLVADFGRGKPNVKNILDAAHSEQNIIDREALEKKVQAVRRAKSPLKLIYFGRLTAYKGVEQCLRATVLARAAGSNVTLDVIGEGNQAEYLHKLTQDLGASPYVTFHNAKPFNQDFFRVLYEFHLLLAAPLREDTPRSALDAMAAGIPYLAFDTYYYRQLLESGAGEVVPWPDVEAMARSIVRLAALREEIVTRIENAIAFAHLNTQDIWLERRMAWTLGQRLEDNPSAKRIGPKV